MQVIFEEHSDPGYQLYHDDPRKERQVSVRVLKPSSDDPAFTPAVIELTVGTDDPRYVVHRKSLGRDAQLIRDAIAMFDVEIAWHQSEQVA